MTKPAQYDVYAIKYAQGWAPLRTTSSGRSRSFTTSG